MIKADARSLLLSRSLPMLRTASAALLLIGVLHWANPENGGYVGVEPHPYLLIACVVGAAMGLSRSLLVTPLIAVAYLAFLRLHADLQAEESPFTPANLLLPLAIVAVPSALGSVTDRLRAEIASLRKELGRQEALVSDLGRASEAIRAESAAVERKLASHMQSVTRVFDYARVFETSEPDRLGAALVDIVREQLGENNAYVYLIEEEGKARWLRRIAFRDESAHPLPELLDGSELDGAAAWIDASIRRKELAYPGKAGSGAGVAAPLLSSSGRSLGAIVLRDLHFLNHVPSTFATLESLGRWGGMSFARAQHLRATQESAFLDPVTGVFSHGYFRKRVEAEFKRARTYSLPLHVLRFRLPGIARMDSTSAFALSRLLAGTLESHRRETDVVTQGEDAGTFRMILAIVSPQEVKEIREKVRAEFESLKRAFDGAGPPELVIGEAAISRSQKDVHEFLAAEAVL